MGLLKLRLILWKNFILRRRHWFLTIIEVLLPILLFALITYGRSEISGLNKVVHNSSTIVEKYSIDYSSLDVGDLALAYTPKNNYTTDIIERVQIKLQIASENVVGFENEEAIKNYFKNVRDKNTKIEILFSSNENTKFTYTIKYYDNEVFMHTKKLYQDSYQYNPGTGSDRYIFRGFLNLQWALDLSYIEKQSGKTLSTELTLQEFPYPPYIDDMGLRNMFSYALPMVTVFSFIFLCPAVIKRVVEEKESGIKELMKMVGMKQWMLWFGWLLHAMITVFWSIIIIVFLLKVPIWGESYPSIEFSDGSIIFIFLFLYCVSSIIFCFFVSCWFSRSTYALIVGILLWVLTYFVPTSFYDTSENMSLFAKIFLGVLPNAELRYGYEIMSSYEEREVGIQWNNLLKSAGGGVNDMTMGYVLLMFIVQIILYSLLTLYLDNIMPGPYGIPKKLSFPMSWIKEKFISPLNSNKKVEDEGSENCPLAVLEKTKMEPSIKVRNLRKKYNNCVAVDGLDLNIYKNQITVLLGQNGAGKTTTMSIITGMIQATSGSVTIHNMDVKDRNNKYMKNLGLCPQHNLLFRDLTVLEHLQFFAMLRGKPSNEAKEEAKKIIAELNLSKKINEFPCNLSGGMQRKLCLGMAVIGDPEVLILDEPTSGMDHESRRELWNLLLKWRGSKTILITTHFMDEADVLGDWIAIMAQGKLQCHGTPMFLKKEYGTGYHLNLTLKPNFNSIYQISETVTEVVNGSRLIYQNANNAKYVLPTDQKEHFSKLLGKLEKNKALGIETMSVSITTLEDVFLRAKESLNDDHILPVQQDKDIIKELQSGNLNNASLFVKIKGQFSKRRSFFKDKIISYVICTIITAIFFVVAIVGSGTIDSEGSSTAALKLNLQSYGETKVYYSGLGTEDMNQLKWFYKQTVIGQHSKPYETENVTKDIITEGIQNIVYYKHHLVAGAELLEIKDSGIIANIMFSNNALHGAPISLNLVMNAFAKFVLGEEYSINAVNSPVLLQTKDPVNEEISKIEIIILYIVSISLGALIFQSCFIIFPYTEIFNKFIRIQYMCGLHPTYYWLMNFLCDMVIFVVLSFVIIILMWIINMMVSVRLFAASDFGVFIIIWFIFGCSAIPHTYLYSRFKTIAGGFAVLIITGMFIGTIPTVIVRVLYQAGGEKWETLASIIKYTLLVFFPHFGLTYNTVNLVGVLVEKYNWLIMHPVKKQIFCRSDLKNQCCTGECDSFFSSNEGEYRTDLLIQLIGMVLYLLLNIAIDVNVIQWIKKKYLKNGPSNGNDEVLRVSDLKKAYSNNTVIKKVNFTVDEGKCFGLLGVNGAGKSTTFRMLTGEEIQDDGTIILGGIENGKDEYLKNIGYCPQSDYLNFSLTGHQLLKTVAQLRGVKDVDKEVRNFIQLFDLDKYKDKPCGSYSGGNKRKLSIAISLIGFPKCILLDEPTNGVDPSSRRLFWNILKNVQDTKKTSIVLTSHSMQECEALCDSLSILKDGEVKKEHHGTIAKLKSKYAGFTVSIKLKGDSTSLEAANVIDGQDEVDSRSSRVSEHSLPGLKHKITEELNSAVLKDEHSGQLYYHIEDKSTRWSALFEKIEELKEEFPDLIEDYVISEASLEDVFLRVAKS